MVQIFICDDIPKMIGEIVIMCLARSVTSNIDKYFTLDIFIQNILTLFVNFVFQITEDQERKTPERSAAQTESSRE